MVKFLVISVSSHTPQNKTGDTIMHVNINTISVVNQVGMDHPPPYIEKGNYCIQNYFSPPPPSLVAP